MCVIMVCQNVRPTDEMIEKAWNQNRDGGGAAWREGDEVVWKKGIQKMEDMRELLHEIPLPFVAHFRIGTVGGKIPTLTHPFGIDKNATIELEGRTKGGVIFHNGHWTEWNDKALDAAIGANRKIPTGDWSDTRAMAWMTDIYGVGFMELMTTQKAVLWTPSDYRVFTGMDGWEEINGVWCSNDTFWKRAKVYTYNKRYCANVGCNNELFGTDVVCWSCRERARQPLDSSKDLDKEDHSATHTTIGTKTVLPALTGRVAPLLEFMTLPEAEELRKRGGMSKSKIKDYRKWYQKLGHGGPQEEKAVKKLTYITNEVGKALLHGTVH